MTLQKSIKTILFTSLIATLILPFSGMNMAEAEPIPELEPIPEHIPTPEPEPTCGPGIVLDNGMCQTSDLGAKSAHDDIIIGQPTTVNITFFNSTTGNVQEHVDYTMAVLDSTGGVVLNSTILHTSTGVVNTDIVFPKFDVYTMFVTAVGISFQPISPITFTFQIPAFPVETPPEKTPIAEVGKWKLVQRGFLADEFSEKIRKTSLHATIISNGTSVVLEDVVYKIGKDKYELPEAQIRNFENPEKDFLIFADFTVNQKWYSGLVIIMFDVEDQMDHFIDKGGVGVMITEGELFTVDENTYHDVFMLGTLTPK